MFSYIAQTKHSYEDYQHLLSHKRFLLNDNNNDGQIIDEDDLDIDDEIGEMNSEQDQHVIEIEIRAFQELNIQRDILEYCKPFSFESLVLDSDDVCRIAVIIARKLLNERIDEFSLSMLQAISDVKEPLEENGDDQILNYK